ncbi:MAG: YlmC/YmxH family sporulation protein [Firmicutes bacterium]|nr:YlmC/YmxH family sporulation protein [Bacillota bacterium]MBR2001462.1 YlmC/YmxH family sporulation protein [Bacillota bacterium]MBR7147926.1 YlmC/YmxH family sporulation protein [Bacillota bacterium]
MRLSDIGYKEIIDLADGGRYGQLSESELLFEPASGQIRALLIPQYQTRLRVFRHDSDFLHLPWSSIKKIGEDIIILDTSTNVSF